MRLADLPDHTLVVHCSDCDRGSIPLHPAFWPAVVERAGSDDLAEMAKRLRCTDCGARGREGKIAIEAHPPRRRDYTREEYELMGLLGDTMRAGRKARKREG